jgi:hypothetical protein
MVDQVIKTISFDQLEILESIRRLHTGDFQMDATFGSGCFWRNSAKPELCFDINPRKPGVMAADVRALPLPDGEIRSVVFDPPFMARTGPGALLKERFGELIGTIQDLWAFYLSCMRELHRVLQRGGWLVFKCQDGVLSGVNNFTHVKVCNMAEDIGFRPVDLFILLAKNRMMHPAHKTQRHARKYHSYFWVFQKVK